MKLKQVLFYQQINTKMKKARLDLASLGMT